MRVGVVGVGYLGRIHAQIYSEMPDVELSGVADIDIDAARETARQCRCKAYTDAQDLLGQVDAVSIAVPTISHLEVAQPFLEAGVHILMEKPLAPSFMESTGLVEMAETSGVVFQVGHLERFNAGVMALAERVGDPRFLEVHRLGTFVERATDVDVVIDLMIHDIDIVLSLVKSPIAHVAASGLPVITDHIDIANARLEFSNGAVANVTASRVSNKRHRRIRVFERRHYYGLNYIDQQLEVVTARPPGPGEQWPEIVTEQIPVQPRQPLNAELDEFVHAIREGREPLVTGRVGLEAVRVAHVIKEKMAACLD